MNLRTQNLRRLADETFDALIVGSGINGAVCAAALAAHGVRVALIDRGDFGGATSQESSNLIWGGIKYLETLELPLVWKLCGCRNELLQRYPANVREIRFLTVISEGFRWPRVFLYLGTWFYWLLGRGFTQTPRLLSRQQVAKEEPIVDTRHSVGGFEYSDAQVVENDARFVFGFVRNALDHGVAAANYVEALSAQRDPDGTWTTTVRDTDSGHGAFAIRSRLLINACGPWANAFNQHAGIDTAHRHVFSKGIHLIVQRLTTDDRTLTFFADDGRMFFVIPMGPVSCIGTTDTRVEDPAATVDEADRDFVLDNINARLDRHPPLTRADILAERCGVRPLVVTKARSDHSGKDWTALSRRHVIECDRARGVISLFGGKLTDCLNVGREVMVLVQHLGLRLSASTDSWFGEPDGAVRADFMRYARAMQLDALTPPGSVEPLAARLWRRYGARARDLLDLIQADPTQAAPIFEGTDLVRAELHHTARHEMVTRLDDFLRRRTRLAMEQPLNRLALSPVLREACAILFPEDTQRRWNEYLSKAHSPTNPDKQKAAA